jgi:predicted oxidoreductase
MRLASLLLIPVLAGCSQPAPPRDADVIVIGAGIAGVAAALEASAAGASVIVLDMNSVGGGHAVKAGGLALVGTPLQAQRGYQDDVDTAVRDLLAWGEDADPDWVRRYLAASGPEVHDWLAGFGVRFAFILDTPQHSVPRFHFARGAAVNVVVPMLDEALSRPAISFLFNHEVSALLREQGRVAGVRFRESRSGAAGELRAATVIIATGGAQGSLEHVREHWDTRLPAPEHLYIGGGAFALGSGLSLAQEAGAALAGLGRQTIFTSGIPDPRDASGRHGLLTQNPAAIWVDARGQRFINEAGPSKLADAAVLRMAQAKHWLLFDAVGLAELRIRDAVWMNPATLQREVLDNPALVSRADTLAELADAAGLPAAALEATVARWNAALARGVDEDHGRIGGDNGDPFARPVSEPPFHAIARYPLTRKSMGGIAVDGQARALDGQGQPVPGLYAAGEVTGVAGINGSHGGEGTFLGPSVWMGRLAGQAAAREAQAESSGSRPASPAGTSLPGDGGAGLDPGSLPALLALEREGYWHFGEVHRTVLERGDDCASCHSAAWPAAAAAGREQQRAQLASCTRCH